MTSLKAAVNAGPTYKARLRAVFDWHASWFASEHFHGCMFIKATEEYAREPEALLALSRRHKAEVAALIEGVIDKSEADAAPGLARLVQVTLDGMIVNAYLFGPEAVDDAWAALAPLLGLDVRPLAHEGEVDWARP